MSGALWSSLGIAESLGCYSTVGFRIWGAEWITHEVLGRVSFFGGDNGACYIGLMEPVSITLLTYDLQVLPITISSTTHRSI